MTVTSQQKQSLLNAAIQDPLILIPVVAVAVAVLLSLTPLMFLIAYW